VSAAAGECFVCGGQKPVEMHHPIPRRAGGEQAGTVPLCEDCHTEIDRRPIDRWAPSQALAAMSGVWKALDVDGRRMLLKMLAITCDAQRMLLVGCASKHIATKQKRGAKPKPIEPVQCAECAATQAVPS
jgi:uncharacterized protein YlaI